MLFIAAFFHAEMHHSEIYERENVERLRDEQSLARLQKSKESADQARLIRVIEREREIMAELREREVRRTEEMRLAKESADKANKAKSAFLAVVSHEIRTPMNGILGMAQLLQKTTLSKSQSDYVQTIHQSGDTMMALLNDILDFEKIESGNMTLEILNFDLHRLVNDVAILMSGHASQKSVALSADIDEHNVPKVVSGDPTRLRQVLLNLVNNAIKFTNEGGISIGVRRLTSENPNVKDKIRIAIKDTGIGIPEESLDKLFTPFTQAENSTTRKYGGTGLGLAISHRLVEAMNSQINVQSVAGQGSTFFFDLDIIIQDEQGQDKQVPDEHFINEGQTNSAKPMTILVTEDNEMNRKVLDGLLSQQGHTLHMASNGLEALDICRKNKLDLILMDIQLGGISGLETTRKLRMEPNPDVANIPVIALTGNIMLEDIQQFFEAGMNGFLAKPIDSKKLTETLYNASIGKFENDPKQRQTPPPEPQAPVKPEAVIPQQEITPPKNPEIFSQAPTQVEEDAYPKEIPDIEQGTSLDLSYIDTGLTFDDREHFVSDSALKPRANIDEDDLLNKTDFSTLAFIDDETPIEKPKQSDEDYNEDDDITEIQRFLIEQKGEPSKKPFAPKTEPIVLPQIIPQAQPDPVPIPIIVNDEPPPTESIISPVNTPETLSIPNNKPAMEKIEETKAEKESISGNGYGIEDLLDLIMIEQLLGTLGSKQFLSLLEGFLNKATELVEVIKKLSDEENLATLGSRAHELKGLSGNFGMKLLSSKAGEIEKYARTSRKEDAIKTAMGLRDINAQTQSILSNWAKENAS
jgi:signal transduction histidine kinase/DNA-binding NarL/FixJ family response regulator/HPt (histidine-containing phosphotransfer) domain-containing protein